MPFFFLPLDLTLGLRMIGRSSDMSRLPGIEPCIHRSSASHACICPRPLIISASCSAMAAGGAAHLKG
jgi:hypothetical protein